MSSLLSSRLLPWGSLFLIASALPACASSPGAREQEAQGQKRLVVMQERLEELERTNGRLGVRVEELEDQVFLLHDRVESARMMLQRRTAARPRPTAETSYREDALPDAMTERPSSRRPIVRLQPPTPSSATPPVAADPSPPQEDFEGDVVMTNEAFERMYGPSTGGGSSSGQGGGSLAPGKAQPSVTSEKIELAQGEAGQTRTQLSVGGIRLYKDSLAKYRSGQYADALRGFQSFLAASPKDDYVDNALYWIGECQYGLNDYAGAVGTFDRLLREQPEGNKVPDAMLKMSLALEKMGQGERSKKVLLDLTSQFPATAAAKLGQKRLDS